MEAFQYLRHTVGTRLGEAGADAGIFTHTFEIESDTLAVPKKGL